MCHLPTGKMKLQIRDFTSTPDYSYNNDSNNYNIDSYNNGAPRTHIKK